LALFGRRLSERGGGLGMPASENLHMNGIGDGKPLATLRLKQRKLLTNSNND
jgi:hypothetical protein